MTQLRWIYGGPGTRIIGGAPTATDALEYAEKLLLEPEEFQCCATDARIATLIRVRQLLNEHR